jgi:hypothetical protein
MLKLRRLKDKKGIDFWHLTNKTQKARGTLGVPFKRDEKNATRKLKLKQRRIDIISVKKPRNAEIPDNRISKSRRSHLNRRLSELIISVRPLSPEREEEEPELPHGQKDR